MRSNTANNNTIPKGAAALFFMQLFSTMAYSVLYATLVLFAVQALHLSAKQANGIIATFVAFIFALHLIGGFLGGRLLSFRGLFLIGMLFQAIGSILISIINIKFLYLGMAIFLAGSGLNMPCINCMITQLFEPEDKRRETAFLWNYSSMNIGFLIGYTGAGYFQIEQQFHLLFLLTSFASIIAFCITLLNWEKLKDVKTHLTQPTVSKIIRAIIALCIILLLIIPLYFILIHANISSKLVIYVGIIMGLIIILLALYRKNKLEKNKLFAYLIFGLASLTFFTLYQLCPMALTLFLERNVDRNIAGFTVPTEWFLNIDTMIAIFGCPLFAYFMHQLRLKGYNINMPWLFSLGLLFIGVAVAILPIGIYFANSNGLVSSKWLFISYTLLALGEVSISPIGYALVGQLAPPKMRGLLMGVWLMISGVAASLSNVFSNIAMGAKQSANPLISNPSYSHTFLYLGLFAILIGLLLLTIKPFILRLINPKQFS